MKASCEEHHFCTCAVDDFIMSLVSGPAAQVSLPWVLAPTTLTALEEIMLPSSRNTSQKPQRMELTTSPAYQLTPLLGSLTPKYCVTKLENVRENVHFGWVTFFHPFS